MRKNTKFLMLFVLSFVGMQGNAQNVTVKPSTGSMIAGVPENVSGTTGDYDLFYRRGGFATWRHSQLCLTMTTSDANTLTENGQLKNPANNLFGRTSTNEIEMGRGASQATRNCYMNLALPKGYRFTGYEIIFSRNRSDFGNDGYQNNANTGGTTRFGETDKDFNYLSDYYQDVTYNASATIDEGSVTISKEDKNGMSNVLYFKLTDANTGTGRMVITFHSITLFFTAEDDYTPVLPQTNITVPVSAVDIPFQTGKVDYGSIERRSYSGQTRVSYSSANVIDMEANMTLYEAGSVKPGTHFDGTNGNVVNYQEGSNFTIRNYNDFFILGKANQEQVYYIESPTYVVLPDANQTKNPVGFRIVGAELEYQYGQRVPASSVTNTKYYITYTTGGTTYYLNTSGRFVAGQPTEWYLDDDNRIYSGSTYLGFNVETNFWGNPTSYTFATSTTVPNHPLTVYNNQYIRGTYSYNLGFSTDYIYLIGSTGTPTVSTSTNNRASWVTNTETINIPAIEPAPFTLYVYDKDGTLKETHTVNSSADNGKVTLTGFNNDAVKFGVQGVGFVKGTLTMQALDPYIDAMNVVCQDQAEGKEAIRMTQPFNANDFSVSGGEFFFYLPSDCVGDGVKISYEDLWSHYADETYVEPEAGSAQHNSRFSFVNSEHYNQYTGDNIYNNTAEAAADQTTVHERQIVEVVGQTKFKFNNADQLNNTAGILTEYPFTQANYTAAPNNGSFDTMTFTVSASDQQAAAYVFTTDETRYNIAPTTAVQHRTYAFYEMIVHVQSATYEPKVEIVKVYDKTYYHKSDSETDATDAFYGAIITAPYGDSEEPEKGFASDLEIQDAITRVLAANTDDFNHTDKPTDAKQLLYVDATGLAGYYINGQHQMTLGAYRTQKLAPNSIIFLPSGVNEAGDNIAAITSGNNSRACNNIVLTDKQPFYSPYNIQVPSQNYAKYSRQISRDDYGKVQNATLILPFALKVTDGVHTNSTENSGDIACSFSLNTMANGQTITQSTQSPSYVIPNVAFTPIGGEWSVANTPYTVQVLSEAVGDNYSFVATQYGASIAQTPTQSATSTLGQQFYTGETASGTYKYTSIKDGEPHSVAYTCTAKGNYSGVQYARSESENIFYFANNQFINLHTLSPKYDYLKVYPFRSVYTYSGGATGEGLLNFFNAIFDDDETGDLDVIAEMPKYVDLAVRSGMGYLSMTSAIDQTVSVRSLNGLSVGELNMRAGDSQSINLPAGIYLVNNVKIIVK